jgi:uncharacterized membrane protein YwzB
MFDMKNVIATKSIGEIIVHMIIVVILSIILLMVYRYDLGTDTPIASELRLFMVVLAALIVILLANLFYMISLPKILIVREEDFLVVRKRRKTDGIPLESIEVISKSVNIWAKPFLVYSDIKIETQEKTHVIRHIKDIPDAVDRIRRLMETRRTNRKQ